MTKWALIDTLLGFGTFLTTFTSDGSLAPFSSFDYESWLISTAQGTGGYYLSVEYSHRSLESCGEELEHHTSQDCICCRQHSSCNDQGMFPIFLRRSTPGLQLTRAQRRTNQVASSSGYFAPMSVERLTGG